MAPRCCVLPEGTAPHLEEAVVRGGGELVPIDEAHVLVWTSSADPDGLRAVLDAHPEIDLVQLPWAGVEPYAEVIDDRHRWTCGKGVYADPVAEHVLALTLGLLRGIGHYARQTSWSGPVGRNLLGARVTILGGGEITRTLVRWLLPFGCRLTVVRRHDDPLPGVAEVVTTADLQRVLPSTDVVILALALTEETAGILDADAIAALPDHAVVINVARGQHIDIDALTTALQEGRLGGAGLDVTEPEPLPEGHPLWQRDDVIITPHVGNTPEMGRPLLAARVSENIARFGRGEPLLGTVDVELGY